MSALLSATGIHVEVGHGRDRTVVVRDFGWTFERGQAVGIVGPSGAGKSTLARALVGLEPGLRGSLRHRGRELVRKPFLEWGPLRREVSLCWQDPRAAVNPQMSLLAAINEPRQLAGHEPWSMTDRELGKLTDWVGLESGLLARRPDQVSGGQRQRAALIRAVAVAPQLLIADEITSAVDRPMAWQIIDRLAELRKQGLGLVVITHDLSILASLVDDLIVLDAGRIVESGSCRSIFEHPKHSITQALLDQRTPG